MENRLFLLPCDPSAALTVFPVDVSMQSYTKYGEKSLTCFQSV